MSTEQAEARPVPPAPTGRIWFGDRMVEPDRARVSPTDHGLVAGNGVFETLKVRAGRAFAVTRHLTRLSRSAEALGLPAPDHDLVRRGIETVAAEHGPALGVVRVTWTGGEGPLGSAAAFGPPTLVVAARDYPVAPGPTAIQTLPWRRNEHGALTGVKTTSYGENVRGLQHAHDHDASEGIFLNTAGHVCEGTGSNLFVVLDGEVVTSPLSSGALAGITRDLVLGLVDVTERDLTLAQAQDADEVFLTSSLRDVQAVSRWDERRYPDRAPVTTRVAELFAAAADVDPDPR